MKKVSGEIGADLEHVSVDASEIRERLLNDEKYSIDQVPTVLVLYSTGQYKTYIGTKLDSWFTQLLQNIQRYQEQMEMQQTQLQAPDGGGQMQYPAQRMPTDDGIPKPLRRKPSGVASDIPQRLPSPGRPRAETTSILDDRDVAESPGSGGIGGDTGFTGALLSEHIRGAEPTVQVDSDPMVQQGRKEVKQDGLSAKDLAKQMEAQREQIDEHVEENRPFM